VLTVVAGFPLCAEVIKSCRFLGRAEVALADTLSMLSGVPAGTPLWLPLMRRDAGDAVRWARLRGARIGASCPQIHLNEPLNKAMYLTAHPPHPPLPLLLRAYSRPAAASCSCGLCGR
jgi:hypothetical protein